MALTETPPETVDAASATATSALRPQPTGLAAVLGSGDHKVIGRLYVATALLFGALVLGLGAALGFESTSPDTLEVFDGDSAFQFFTLFRVGAIFLLALPLVIGVALAVVPLQVGARTAAFPRAAAASYWGWLMGSGLLLASYAMNGGPGGGSSDGVNLWIAAMGLLVVSILLAAISLATTVLALRPAGMRLNRVPMFAWSVAVASILWLLTLPVLFALLVLLYVDHRHGGSTIGANAEIYGRITWLLRNPQIYVVAIPVLGFAADVLPTTAKARLAPRAVVQAAIGVFGVLSFGAFLLTADASIYEEPFLIGMALVAIVPVLAVLGASADSLRRGKVRPTAGALYAIAAVLVLLLGVAAGALGAILKETNGTIYDVGVSHAMVLAAVIASLGGVHWWATKILRQPATEAIGMIAPLLLLVGALATVVPNLVSGITGEGVELAPDFTGGIEGLNLVGAIGFAVVILGLLAAAVSFLPGLKRGTDVPADPWEGQTLEWLTASPPPLHNFDGELPTVTSAEPLTDQREEDS